MIDHLVLFTNDVAASKTFYGAALATLSYELAFVEASETTGELELAGFSVDSRLEIILRKVDGPITPLHLAFAATSRSLVDDFYQAAMSAGGRDNGAPEICPEYHPHYYGGFVFDPDGHKIEAVCHKAEG